jgi:hypothetical protein
MCRAKEEDLKPQMNADERICLRVGLAFLAKPNQASKVFTICVYLRSSAVSVA